MRKFLIAALALCLTTQAHALQPTITGTASVIDGDTLEIHGVRIRMFGIDAPEGRQLCTMPDGSSWRCGPDAANALSNYIARRPVECHQRDTDRYGRVVAVCYASGIDLSGWMVSEGWALAYSAYSRDYLWHEATAKSERKGIWISEFEKPWVWRRNRK